MKDEVVSRDQRVIGSYIATTTGDTVASIVNIYAPAVRTERIVFFSNILDIPFLHYTTNPDIPGFVVGNFNMSIPTTGEHTTANNRLTSWHEWISNNFFNCFPSGLPTFQRGSITKSTIDYIFGRKEIASLISGCQQVYLPSQ